MEGEVGVVDGGMEVVEAGVVEAESVEAGSIEGRCASPGSELTGAACVDI